MCFKYFKSISRFRYPESGNALKIPKSLQKEKKNVEANGKTTSRTDKILMRNIKINIRKTIMDLRKGLLDYGVEASTSTVRKRFLEVCRKATRPRKKQFITQKMMKTRSVWAKKYQLWTVND
ncbi:hypothetical protein TNCV_3731541 [Trichonephila clavipes]|nr:hypothetical protein TNCV_3731541 [Trichonephila clavipes]